MNILIISDIHGSHERLRDVLNTPYPYDMVVLVGDNLYHGPRNPILEDYNPQKVADQLNGLSVPVLAVRGNCDAEVDQMLLNFSMMQDYTVTNLNNITTYITHGHLLNPVDDGPKKRSRLFISGHTHVPTMNDVDGVMLFNPGSIALPKEGHPNTYGYLSGTTLTTFTLKHEVYMTSSLS